MRIIILVLGVIAFHPCVTQASKLSTAATEIIQNARQKCNDLDNGEFYSTEKAIVLHDFAGDGKPEELIDAAQFSCSTAATLWGGSGGTYLWVVAPDKTYEFLAHKWRVIDVDGQSVLLLAVHSYQCSDKVGPCYRAYVWQNGFRTTRSGND